MGLYFTLENDYMNYRIAVYHLCEAHKHTQESNLQDVDER